MLHPTQPNGMNMEELFRNLGKHVNPKAAPGLEEEYHTSVNGGTTRIVILEDIERQINKLGIVDRGKLFVSELAFNELKREIFKSNMSRAKELHIDMDSMLPQQMPSHLSGFKVEIVDWLPIETQELDFENPGPDGELVYKTIKTHIVRWNRKVVEREMS